jgi:hypothetical protein
MLFLLLVLIVAALSRTVWGHCISAVSVSPANPAVPAPVKIVVEGNVPAMSCRLNGTGFRRLNNTLLLDMYWRSTGYGGVAVAPYRHEQPVGPLAAGRYKVMVRSICDGLTREMEETSFTVSYPVGIQPMIWPSASWYPLLSRGTDNSRSSTLVQSILMDGESVSADVSFDSDGTGRQGPRRENRVG